MKAGKDLDARVGKLIGEEPRRIAIATNDGGESAAVIQNLSDGPFWTKEQVAEWARDNRRQGYELGEWLWYKHYSTDIAAAWELVEKIKQRGLIGFGVEWRRETSEWIAGPIDIGDFGEDYRYSYSTAQTAPHAICLAALQALE